MPEVAIVARPEVAAAVSPRTTVGLFLRQAARWGTRPLLQYACGEAWHSLSWAQAHARVLRIAAALHERGVAPGQRVLLFAENRPEWLLCDLGIQAAGALTVPVYATLSAAAAQQIARDSGASFAIVSDAARADRLAGVAGLRDVVTMDREVAGWMARASRPELGAAVARRASALAADDLATVIYTSGTSGDPKGALITHQSIVTMAEAGRDAFEVGPDDVILSFLPYAHVFERVSGLYTPLAAGATIWIARGAEHLPADIARARPTVMLGIPRLFEKMVAAVEDHVRQRPWAERAAIRAALAAGKANWRGERPGTRLARSVADRLVLAQLRQRLTGGRLRFFISGGAPLRPEVEEFFWALGVPLYQGWGLTETTSAVSANRPGAWRRGTVGRPLPGVAVRVAADGELLVRGPGVMRGYLGQPAATVQAFDEGWLRTGDVGQIDGDGYVRLTDRKKDLIKTSGGKYIAPQPLEARLQGCRYIAAAVVVGDDRPYAAALIAPDWELLRRDYGWEGTQEQLARDARVRGVIGAAIETINREVESFETIKRFRLIAEDFSEASGDLTPSQKVRRRLVQRRYRWLIDEMYGGPR
jgi:long-chain acyl-CoA synthetase